MTTRVYVAGPMTGRDDWNFPEFERATAELREAGFEVQSPHEFDLEDGFDPSGDGADFDLREALERDVEAVLAADGVALLDGWEESPGAVVEVLTAASQGTPALPVREFLQRFALAVAMILAIVAGTVGVLPDAEGETRFSKRERVVAAEFLSAAERVADTFVCRVDRLVF